MSVAPGSRLGSYEVVALLGAGGMGEVYRAHHHTLGRDVALKVLPGTLSHDPDRVARFEREARAVAALSHPNILAIHDFGCDNGVHYAVTELLDGQTLRDLLHTGPVPVPKAMAITTQIARGLEAAHAGGIVHRDLKPENIFVLRDGQIKILDFGLAKAAPIETGATTQLMPGATEAGTVVGTAGYMSPEQVRRDPVDHRSDLFSLGCVFYEMLAGRRAFQGDSSIDTLHATLHVEPPNVGTLVAVPAPLARIVSRCLEKHPGNRFQSAADLRFALDTITESSRSAVRPPIAERRPRPVLRMGVAVIVIVGTVAGGWYWQGGAGRGAATPATTLSQPRGIAVLPFENLAGPDQAYFAAGVTEELTLQIAKISSIRVMSRAAVSRFKDPAGQLPDMVRDLGIGAVLTGSVRHAGSQVRVGVQLLAAPSGETLWSEQYDRTIANIFEVQSDIAVRVARALRAALAPEERRRIERVPTDNTQAYELYLQQRRFARGTPDQNEAGIEVLQKAIALDPNFALAHSELAYRYVFKGNVYGRVDYMRAVEAARTAVRIDPNLARGHHALGSALNHIGRVDEGRLSFQRAIELDGSDPDAMYDLALMELNSGRLDQSAYWSMRGWPLAPNLSYSYYHVGLTLVMLDEAVAERWLTAAVARFGPDNATSTRLVMLRAVLAFRRGDTRAGLALARDAARLTPNYAGSRSVLAEAATHAGAADAETLVDALLKESYSGRGWWSAYTPRTLRAFLHLRAGQPERARPLLETVLDLNRKEIEDGDHSEKPWAENVAAHALLGEREAAMAAFERAVDLNYYEAKVDVYDALLASLKDDPRFMAGLARVRRRIAEMRARTDLTVIDEWIARGAPATAVR
jgi:TolB-like protein